MKRLYLHPPGLRVWHWLNAAVIIALIATGGYLRLHGIASLRPHDPVLAWHRGSGVIAVILTAFWFIDHIRRKDMGGRFGIGKGDLGNLLTQARYYAFSIFRGKKDPFQPSAERPYNPLQRIAYIAVMLVMLPLQALTGVLFSDIQFIRGPMISWGLFAGASAIHALIAYLICLYLIVHVYMATLGERFFTHTKAMITGWEEWDEDDERASTDMPIEGENIKEGIES